MPTNLRLSRAIKIIDQTCVGRATTTTVRRRRRQNRETPASLEELVVAVARTAADNTITIQVEVQHQSSSYNSYALQVRSDGMNHGELIPGAVFCHFTFLLRVSI